MRRGGGTYEEEADVGDVVGEEDGVAGVDHPVVVVPDELVARRHVENRVCKGGGGQTKQTRSGGRATTTTTTKSKTKKKSYIEVVQLEAGDMVVGGVRTGPEGEDERERVEGRREGVSGVGVGQDG